MGPANAVGPTSVEGSFVLVRFCCRCAIYFGQMLSCLLQNTEMIELFSYGFASHSRPNRSFGRRSSQSVFWLGIEETTLNTTKLKTKTKTIYANA